MTHSYNSADAFTSAFKSFHGITPSGAKSPNAELQSFQRFTFNPDLTITGGNNNMQYRNISLEETIYFYLHSDYLLYNTLLGGKMNKFWKKAEKVNGESKGMLKEFEEGIRTLDEKQIARYHNRIFEKLDDEAKEKVIKIAKIDISNLLGAMKQIKSDRLFYRTVWCEDLELDGLSQPHHYDVNDIVEFKTMSSTSISPYRESKADPDVPYAEWINAELGREFYRYEITVPENGSILELGDYEEYSQRWWEKDEILLPPMKCRVTNKRDSDNEKCKGIIEFEYLERLPDPV